MRVLLTGVAIAAAYVIDAALIGIAGFGAELSAYADDRRGAREVLRIDDPDITESSGLAVTADRVLTTNDSGDVGRVFVIDRATGETVGETRWSDEAVDVEALAPVGSGVLWVGDIGDNRAERDSVQVVRIMVGDGARSVTGESFDLLYPNGPRDAEALLVHPTSRRLVVVSKGVVAGTIYRAPARLDEEQPNRLQPIGRAPGLVTDGSFFPGGRHLVLRTYRQASVLTWPELEEVGAWALPAQPQGEGIAVGPDGALYLSSEGMDQPVLRVEVPRTVRAAMANGAQQGPGPSGSASASADAQESLESPAADSPDDGSAGDDVQGRAWMSLSSMLRAGPAVIMGGVLALVSIVVLRRRARRTP